MLSVTVAFRLYPIKNTSVLGALQFCSRKFFSDAKITSHSNTLCLTRLGGKATGKTLAKNQFLPM